jgi:hypothetical protein
MIGFTALFSAFLNNTAVVASLMGPLKMSRQHAPSRLLMPMCFAASLGGILTLVGICIVLVCGLLMLFTMPVLLPHAPLAQEARDEHFVEATV